MSGDAHLKLQLTGNESDQIPLGSFLTIAQYTHEILRKLSQSDPVKWRVESLSLQSPLCMQIGAEDSPQDSVADAVNLYVDLFETLSENRRPSLRISPSVIQLASKMVYVLGDGIASLSISAPGRNTIIPNRENVRSSAKHWVAQTEPVDYSEQTSIEGVLKALSIVDGRRVYIYDRLTDVATACVVDEGIFHELFVEANLGRRVSMQGQVLFKKGKPSEILVHSFEFLPSGESPPSRGPSRVDLTGGLDSVDYLRKMRDGT